MPKPLTTKNFRKKAHNDRYRVKFATAEQIEAKMRDQSPLGEDPRHFDFYKYAARITGTDYDDHSGFHYQDPPIVDLRIASGTHAFADPAGSMTNKTNAWQVSQGR